MGIAPRQIGWSNESNLLWNISKQLERLTGVTFTSLSALAPTYKVYTALLTQSGGDDPLSINEGLLTIGVTYTIQEHFLTDDFTNVGAPNNLDGTSFVATGTTPTKWTDFSNLTYNSGAPVVTVLENTIGNIWFTYQGGGQQVINSNNLFTIDKTYSTIQLNTEITAPDTTFYAIQRGSDSTMALYYYRPTTDSDGTPFTNTPIEIRVYN